MAKKIKGKGSDGKEVEIEVEDGPEALTEEALDAKMNAMMTARLKRFEDSIGKMLETKLSTLAPPEEKPAKGKKDGEPTDERLRALQDQLENLKKTAAEADRARDEAESRRKAGEKARSLSAALQAAGVSPALQEAAQALLESKGKVVLNDDGSVGFKTRDKYGTESVTDLKEGLSTWFKDEGAAFVPAKGAGGAGTPGPSRAPSGPGKPRQLSPEEARVAQKAAAERELGRALMGLPPESEG